MEESNVFYYDTSDQSVHYCEPDQMVHGANIKELSFTEAILLATTSRMCGCYTRNYLKKKQ